MKRFIILEESSPIGYQEHIHLNEYRFLDKFFTLRRNAVHSAMTRNELRVLLKQHSSLRVGIGWSFESATHINTIMKDCEIDIMSKYPSLNFYQIESDLRCDWFGFNKFNIFDEFHYSNFGADDLHKYNIILLEFQESVIKYVMQHKIYRYHAILRDDRYRFNFYKVIRHNPIELEKGFQYYLSAIKEISGLSRIPKDYIEEFIGCHYLKYPDVFFELLNFHILKGDIYE